MGKSLFFFLFISLFSFAQTTFTGTILDDKGQPLYGATVIIKDSNNGTVTDASLNYQWDDGFKSNSPVFPGSVPAKNLVDLILGLKLNESLHLELAAINLLNNRFRALPGFPRLGRTVTGRLVMNLN